MKNKIKIKVRDEFNVPLWEGKGPVDELRKELEDFLIKKGLSDGRRRKRSI